MKTIWMTDDGMVAVQHPDDPQCWTITGTAMPTSLMASEHCLTEYRLVPVDDSDISREVDTQGY